MATHSKTLPSFTEYPDKTDEHGGYRNGWIDSELEFVVRSNPSYVLRIRCYATYC